MGFSRLACVVAGLGLVACGGGKPTPFHHADPAFTLDLPSGFHAGADARDPLGNPTLRIDGAHASDYVEVTWKPGAAADVAAATDEARAARSPSVPELGRGKTAGGATYLDLDLGHATHDFHAWLVVKDQLVTCFANGGDAAVSVCKSLRP